MKLLAEWRGFLGPLQSEIITDDLVAVEIRSMLKDPGLATANAVFGASLNDRLQKVLKFR